MGRRSFQCATADDQLAALAARLRERGVTDAVLEAEAEADLTGLAADVSIRGTERLTLLEAAAEAGLEPDEARHVWHTVGVAVGEDDDAAFAPNEVEVLHFYAAGSELFGAMAVLQALRVIGSAFVRIAEAEVAVLRLAFEVPFIEAAGLPGIEDLPAVRVGAACGEALNRDGDYYGSVVNLASRLVTLAEPGEVLIDRALAAAAGVDAVEALAAVEVKGFPDPVNATAYAPDRLQRTRGDGGLAGGGWAVPPALVGTGGSTDGR